MIARSIPAAALALALALVAIACDGTTGGTTFNRPRPPHPEVLDAPATDVGDAVDAVPAPAPPALTAPAGSLDAVFAALRRVEGGADDGGRVLISMFGDSHTAGDALTAHLRARLQLRFGDAGRGLVAVGRPPYRHYYQHDVAYGSTGAWRAVVGGRRGDSEPIGIMGFRVETAKAAEAWVETCGTCPTGTRVSRFDLLYWIQPGGGSFEYRVDTGKWQRVSTAARAGTAARADAVAIDVADGPHRLTVRRAKKGTIALFGVALDRDAPGVELDGLGVVGRRVGHLHQWDWSVIGPQLARRDPRLVILQYGTNEADDPDLDLDRVAMQYDEVLARLHAVVPHASVLVLGPPDLGQRAAGKACDKPPPRRRPATEPPDAAIAPECEWRTPPALGQVIEVQRAAAARAGVAFFDTFAAMGGADRMEQFVTAEPRLAYGDRTHFTQAGYELWGDQLLGELLAAYTAWTPPPPPASGSGGP